MYCMLACCKVPICTAKFPVAQLKPLAATGVVADHARLMTCTYGIAELTGSLCKLAFHFMRAPQ